MLNRRTLTKFAIFSQNDVISHSSRPKSQYEDWRVNYIVVMKIVYACFFLKIISSLWSLPTCRLVCHSWKYGKDRLQWWRVVVVVVVIQWWDLKSPINQVIYDTSDVFVVTRYQSTSELFHSEMTWLLRRDERASERNHTRRKWINSASTAVAHITGASWRTPILADRRQLANFNNLTVSKRVFAAFLQSHQ